MSGNVDYSQIRTTLDHDIGKGQFKITVDFLPTTNKSHYLEAALVVIYDSMQQFSQKTCKDFSGMSFGEIVHEIKRNLQIIKRSSKKIIK